MGLTTTHGGTVRTFVVNGDKEIERLLAGFPRKMQERFLKGAMRNVGQASTARAKERVKKVTRTLARSIGYRVYKKGESIGVVIGPRKNYGRWVTRETIGKRNRRLRTRAVGRKENWSKLQSQRRWSEPTNYGHIVEGGFKHKKTWGPRKGEIDKEVEPQPFMAPSLKEAEAMAIARQAVKEAVDKVRT